MQSPKQVIEHIRKIRFGIGLDTENLSNDQKAALQDKEKILEDAARLAKEINSRKPHFIFELIQNAEDNDYEKGTKPKIKFIINTDELVIQNNEKGFNGKNVWALCGIGQTTKTKALGYIGEKGIGFKSVFMVTNEPHLYSNGFQFKFKYDRENPVSIIVPRWLNEIPDSVELTQTNIILPFRPEEKSEISQYLDQIHPSLLLFLRNLRVIEIQNRNQRKPEKIERHGDDTKVKIVHGENKSYWKVVKKLLEKPDDIEEERRKDIHESEVVLAFPLNEDETVNSSNEQSVFSFLPIRKYGFKFIIQANFLLAVGREDIIRHNKWNQWLRDSISIVFVRAVKRFKQDEKLKATFYNYIPLPSEITDEFFVPVVEQIHSLLRENDCILTESGSWEKPEQVFLVDADNPIRTLIPNKDLKTFFDKEYLSSKVKARRTILERIGMTGFELDDLVSFLAQTKWIEKQSDTRLIDLYEYLGKRDFTLEQQEKLKNLKIIRLENNTLTSVSAGPIFFPLDRRSKDRYGFENELRIVKRPLAYISQHPRTPQAEKKNEKVRRARSFLADLGVQRPNAYEIIEDYILPIYEDGSWTKKSNTKLLGFVRYIKDHLEDYEKESDKRLNGSKRSWERREDPLKRLKACLRIRNHLGDYSLAEKLYLPKVYGNENDLEGLFEGIEEVQFVHREYIADIFKKYRSRGKAKKRGKRKPENQVKRKAEIREWREFFEKVGANVGMKVVTASGSYLTYKDKSQLRGNSWNYTKEEITDYDLEGLDSLCDEFKTNPQKKKAKILFALLERQWQQLSKFTELTYDWRYYSWYSKNADSTWLHSLKTTAWLPTSQGTFLEPWKIFLNATEIRKVMGDTVPYLAVKINSRELIKALGINTEPDTRSILSRLQALVEQNNKDKVIFEDTYELLNDQFYGNEEEIRDSFSDNPLIFLPDTVQGYFTNREVFWKDMSDILGDRREYLENHYPSLKVFFVERLQVRETPTPEDYADVLDMLSDLSKQEGISKKDETIILRIYEQLNSCIRDSKYSAVSDPTFWDDFREAWILWTDKGFWKNDEDVFINDSPDLYSLFKDRSGVVFLKLPEGYPPDKLRHFIREMGLQYLSKAVETEPTNLGETPRKEPRLSEQIQTITPYIIRYLCSKEYDTYEQFKADGVLAQFRSLEILSVDNLQVKYTLNGESAFAQCNTLLHEGKLFVQKNCIEETDDLAIELAKLFGELKGLDDFIALLFEKQEPDKIEKLLKAKGIHPLAKSELDSFPDTLPPDAPPPDIPPDAPPTDTPPDTPPPDIPPPNLPIRKPLTVITQRRTRDSRPANWVKGTYAYHCQICLSREKPEVLTYNRSYAGQEANRKSIMEAHHIREVAKDKGHDHIGNYLSLCLHHHNLLPRLNLSLGDLRDSLNGITKKEIVWPNGESVMWKMVTFSIEEGNQPIQIVFNPIHLEKLEEYISYIYSSDEEQET